MEPGKGHKVYCTALEKQFTLVSIIVLSCVAERQVTKSSAMWNKGWPDRQGIDQPSKWLMGGFSSKHTVQANACQHQWWMTQKCHLVHCMIPTWLNSTLLTFGISSWFFTMYLWCYTKLLRRLYQLNSQGHSSLMYWNENKILLVAHHCIAAWGGVLKKAQDFQFENADLLPCSAHITNDIQFFIDWFVVAALVKSFPSNSLMSRG